MESSRTAQLWEDLRARFPDLAAHLAREGHLDTWQVLSLWDAVRHQREGLEPLLSHMPGVVYRCVMDPHWTMRLMTANARELTGHAAQDFIDNRVLSYAQIIHEADRARVQEVIQAAVASGQGWDLEYRIYHRDGGIRWVHERGTAAGVEEDGLPLLDGYVLDITRHKDAESQLQQARAEAESADRAKTAFLATMSHEIRTPMNGVIGMLDVLAADRLDEDQREVVATARESAFSLLRLIDDILDFSRVEAGRLELERVPVAVVELTEGVCVSMAAVAAKQAVDLELTVAPEVPDRIWSDPVRLRQVLYNLVGNAAKFSARRDGGRGRVKVGLDTDQGEDGRPRLLLAVRDDGIGMDPEGVQRLFSMFTQADASTTRRYGGSGLGLAICERLVRLMEGEIRVETAPGSGAEFRVGLPLEVVARDGDAHGSAPLQGVECLLHFPGETALAEKRAVLARAGAAVRVIPDLNTLESLPPPAGVRVLVQRLDPGGRSTAHPPMPAAGGIAGRVLIVPGKGLYVQGVGVKLTLKEGAIPRRRTLLRAVTLLAGRSAEGQGFSDALEMRRPVIPDRAQARREGRLVLVVEDDRINQSVLLRQLAMLGYAAEVAADGETALRLWSPGRFAAVLSDLHMPGMEGWALVSAIRDREAQGGHTRTPILMTTADARVPSLWTSGEHDIDGYLRKPITLRQLHDALKRHVAPVGNIPPPGPPSTGPAPPTPEGPGMDLEVLRAVVGSDPAALQEFIQLFRGTCRERLERLGAALEQGDTRTLTATAHQFKSAARSVGAARIADLCARIESLEEGSDGAVLDRQIRELGRAVRELEQWIDDHPHGTGPRGQKESP
ncbi:PAS domain S-box-containing protein [Ectothiorhodospira mobilis]|uniref:Sensory/regulatory protein RpfC n=1 Tax=Ectothiorhodospira mobilis TaxID=195064 RepID=A0A1I4QKG6_ECTMO|nr:PAS domain-containing hybrid sensor histidine kinase/response regulator [Ectothiorhodospira mobilis]SFM40113.1 PAS domain S-box-containing protein [Ectothiorhodospira mobilis]